MLGAYRRRKRPVTACQPCYQKKQRVLFQKKAYSIRPEPDYWQCDRQVPCSNCARRQQPKLCHYVAVMIRQSPGEAESSNALEKCQPYRHSNDFEYPPFQTSQVTRQEIIENERQPQPMERLLEKVSLLTFEAAHYRGNLTNSDYLH